MGLRQNYVSLLNEWIQVIHLFRFLMGAPCTCLCSTNSEISSGTIWNYRIFHNTAKNVKEPPLFPPSYDLSLFPKLWSLHSEDFHVVSLLCSRQADFSHKCRSALHSFSSFVLILFCNYFPCSRWSSLFHTKKRKYLFEENKPEECEGLQELWARGSRNADCSAVSHETLADKHPWVQYW